MRVIDVDGGGGEYVAGKYGNSTFSRFARNSSWHLSVDIAMVCHIRCSFSLVLSFP